MIKKEEIFIKALNQYLEKIITTDFNSPLDARVVAANGELKSVVTIFSKYWFKDFLKIFSFFIINFYLPIIEVKCIFWT